MKKKVAIIGSNGIPAKYGGYETLAEHLVEELAEIYDISVYCSRHSYTDRPRKYKKANMVYLPLKANGWQSIPYDLISYIHASLTGHKSILVLGASGAMFFPLNLLFKRNLIMNHGGLKEWEREKANWLEKKWSFFSRKVSAGFIKHHVGDNPYVAESLKECFGVEANIIEYGGDHAKKTNVDNENIKKYPFLGGEYAVCVARAQIDNNLHLLIDSFKEAKNFNVVIVSNWSVSRYGQELYEKYVNKYENIKLLKAIYDLRELNLIRGNASVYIHSHSYCGTSPSLVEAMHMNIPIICFDVPTNRYTTNNKAFYFKNEIELINILNNLNRESLEYNRQEMLNLANERYRWKVIGKKYSKLFN